MVSAHKRRKKNDRGFGLLETVIAAGILTLVVGSSLALTSAVTRNTITSQDRTTANMLAQEIVEQVINTVQTNIEDECPETDWAWGLTGSWGFVDFTTVTISCNGVNTPKLRWQFGGFPTTIYTTVPSPNERLYRRQIYITCLPSDPTCVGDQRNVTVNIDVFRAADATLPILVVTKTTVLTNPQL